MIHRVFVVVGPSLYHKDAKTLRIAKFLVAALPLCFHRWFHFVRDFVPKRVVKSVGGLCGGNSFLQVGLETKRAMAEMLEPHR